MNIRLLILPIILISFVQCCPTKDGFQKKIPFTLTESFYQDWMGGQAGVSGSTVQLIVKDIKSDVQPNYIYFKNRKEKIDIKTTEKNAVLWIANFSDNIKKPVKKDIIMHADSKEEFGNTPPQITTTHSFDLKANEAVISYSVNGVEKYHKLTNLMKKESLFYPAPQPKR
ncbi:MAG TPA: hypothetical protein EYG92_12395 [Lutibacter sp.]|nr:hypothetical protein [Lutibacter sp.]